MTEEHKHTSWADLKKERGYTQGMKFDQRLQPRWVQRLYAHLMGYFRSIHLRHGPY